MKRSTLKVLIGSALMSAALATSAFAAEIIKEISFEAYMDDGASIDSGVYDPEFIVTSNGCDLSWETESNNNTGKSARTYTLTFQAQSGYEFAEAKNVNITHKGIASLSSSKREAEDVFVVKVKAFPYFAWEEPELEVSENGKSIRVSKKGAPYIQYVIEYTDKKGADKSVHKTTSGAVISLTSYMKEASESDIEKHDYQDMEVTGVTVRCFGRAGNNSHKAGPSPWVSYGDECETGVYFKDYESWGDLFKDDDETMTSDSAVNQGSIVGMSGPGTVEMTWHYDDNGKWIGNGDGIYRINQWYQDTDGSWYYLGPNGYALTNAATPDGRNVGADGRWDGNGDAPAAPVELPTVHD